MNRSLVWRGEGELWMGGYEPGTTSGFDLVVSSAAEATPDGPYVVHLRLDDYEGQMDDERAGVMVRGVARLVATLVLGGRKVLIHCGAGYNRSGVVCGRALMFMGFGAREAIDLIRERRGPMSLSNPGFVRWLLSEGGETARDVAEGVGW